MKKTKKATTKKTDYLKITSIIVSVVAATFSVYIWWNPDSLVNTLTTATTTLFYGLVPSIILGTIAFIILMLIDAWKQRRPLWFVLILIGPFIIALLYFLIHGPNLPKNWVRPAAWVAIILFLVYWVPFAVSNLSARIDPFDPSQLEPTGNEVKARVITDSLREYTYEGETICREMKESDDYYVEVTGGSISIPANPTQDFSYRFSVQSESEEMMERQSGVESFADQSNNIITPATLLGNTTQINGPLKGCQIELSTASN